MSAEEKSRLRVADQNMDYAGKELYESKKYTNSMSVHVTKEQNEQKKKKKPKKKTNKKQKR